MPGFQRGGRMVSKGWTPGEWRTPPSIENLHRIKSAGFFANFRRIKFNANTCDLSTAVTQGSMREIKRNVARYRSEIKRDGRGREMFFLLRLAFWLGLVLVLLPRDK